MNKTKQKLESKVMNFIKNENFSQKEVLNFNKN